MINLDFRDDYLSLVKKYGEANVEETMIYIHRATDPNGLAVNILPTKARVAELLDVVHRDFLDD